MIKYITILLKIFRRFSLGRRYNKNQRHDVRSLRKNVTGAAKSVKGVTKHHQISRKARQKSHLILQ